MLYTQCIKATEEDNIMKTTNLCRQALPYPNAATRRQIVNRILDMLLMAAIGAGLGAMLLLGLALA